jgi:hypothetical protein
MAGGHGPVLAQAQFGQKDHGESSNQSFANNGIGFVANANAMPVGVSSGGQGARATDAEVARCQGTELVMLYDYKVRAGSEFTTRETLGRSRMFFSLATLISLSLVFRVQAQAPDDLSVRRGDWVYADLNNQTVDGWLWAYAPKTRKYGFIPKAYARPPAMTSL